MAGSAIVLGVGAERGLGAAIARRFAAEGLHTIVSGRTKDKLDAVVESIAADGGSAEALAGDATDAGDIAALLDHAAAQGAIDAVIYNVGNNAIIPFAELTSEQFEQFWRVCCLGGMLTAKAAMPILAEQGHGSMLFTGASASLRGRPAFAHFAAAKAGLRMLAQSLAREYGPEGVHVGHVVVDGVIDGEMVRSRFGEYLEQLGEDGSLDPDAIAENFWHLHSQHRSAWTHEIDLRPFKENW
ncbi:MAG: SDR family NAD(P)-dependent oxidoreductase [Parasphingopyxis sp.]|uniref:SDR family NAD(P)-dependent oxidoreductase n=1 Tax=Parasphingopyxis sp. TaxID=1920299 RepID=UPI003FA0EAB5